MRKSINSHPSTPKLAKNVHSSLLAVVLMVFFVWISPEFNSAMKSKSADLQSSAIAPDSSLTQPEVYAWGNFNGIRIDGQLMEFRSSLRIQDVDGNDIHITAKEQQRPRFLRNGATQIISTQLDKIDFTMEVTEAGNGSANVTVTASSDTTISVGGVFFTLELPAKYYAEGSIEIDGSTSRNIELRSISDDEIALAASRIKFTSDKQQLLVSLIPNDENGTSSDTGSANDADRKERHITIKKAENGDVLMYIPFEISEFKPGVSSQLNFTLQASGEVDHSPVHLVVDTSKPGRDFHGLGGNFRLQNMNTDPQVIDYNVENLRIAWSRFEMPWRLWHPDENTDPYQAAMSGDLNPHVKNSMEIAKRFYDMGIPVMLATWSGPDWAIVGEFTTGLDETGQRGNPLNQEKIEEIYASITAYHLYLRDVYGVEVKYYSFNESDLGIYVRQTPQEHAEFIKGLGSYMRSKGLDTKILLGDTSDANVYKFIDVAMDDPSVREFMGPVSFHSWRGWDDDVLQKLTDAAERMDLPLIVGEGSIDAAGWQYPTFFEEPIYALQEIDLYTKILAINQPMSILQWQLTSDYSVLSGGGVFGNHDEPLHPTQRFWQLKQHASTPENVRHMPISDNHESVTSAALGNNETDTYAFHLVNNGATRPAQLDGLPSTISKLRIFVTNQTKNMEEGPCLDVNAGSVEFELEATSYVTLMTGCEIDGSTGSVPRINSDSVNSPDLLRGPQIDSDLVKENNSDPLRGQKNDVELNDLIDGETQGFKQNEIKLIEEKSSATSIFVLNEKEYFQNRGVGVMPFLDTAPESHQSGVIIVSHGNRIATNGDLRLEPTPGQWSPVPKLKSRTVDRELGEVRTSLTYPDSSMHLRGFNPLMYPDLHFNYEVIVSAKGDEIHVRVDLDRELPADWHDQVGFTMEFYPPDLFGKSWHMDSTSGIFPHQAAGVVSANGTMPMPQIVPTGPLNDLLPLPNHNAQSAPLATGKKLTIAPETEEINIQIETLNGELELLDGRAQHQNGWFVVRSKMDPNKLKGAIEWVIRPNVISDWIAPRTMQYSMVGYHPKQQKIAVLEVDPNDSIDIPIELHRINPSAGMELVKSSDPAYWGIFLRYDYYHFDFSDVTREGMYQLTFGDQKSEVFKIGTDVYNENVWQPTLDYFLPVQMCHVRVKEKYKLWHDLCHEDDALMAQVGINHFDGYVQGPSTLTEFEPGEHVPGLNRGGWHDAGDDDLRIESQSDEIFMLAATYDEFGIERDQTLIDQELRLVEIREPDGKADLLQQIEHGLLSVLGGYQSMGRLYRGIIVPTLTQYVMAGDAAGQTDGRIYQEGLPELNRDSNYSGIPDDRWVFTEENPSREFQAIGNIASSVIAMRGYNDELADEALRIAEELWEIERPENNWVLRNKIFAAVELFRATKKEEYRDFILSQRNYVLANIPSVGWSVSRVIHDLGDARFIAMMRRAVIQHQELTALSMKSTPYGVPLEMQLWGRGWTLQRQAVEHYFLHKAFPTEFSNQYMLNVINYVLGTQPGSNNQSYASGVGARSKTSSYGYNRMDAGYIPGGVIVGTALIKPDFPELKQFPYLWQQSEYVLGGGSSNFMFIVLAADKFLNQAQ